MRYLFFLTILIFSCQNKITLPAKLEPALKLLSVNHADQISKPTVIMISIDGFRHDYLEKFQPPTLISWADKGVRAAGLVPSFPSLTFPNHVTLVTGLRPGHHGIVGNRFYDKERKEFYSIGDLKSVNDGSWYHGTPLWAAAEKEGMLSATCFWVGSEAKIGGVDPAYFKTYDEKISNEQRVKWVTEWLNLPEENRPHFIGLYFSDVDTMGHRFGPISNETKKAVSDIDTELAKLKMFIEEKKLDVQIIVVSDHGMKNVEQTIDLSTIESIKNLKTSGSGAEITFYGENKDEINHTIKEIKKIQGPFQIYKVGHYPKRWQLDDPNRQGDFLIVGNPGVNIFIEDGSGRKIGMQKMAGHGWDTAGTTELNGLFIASGSKFKRGLRIKAFDNIHVQPLVTHLLELKNLENVDGEFKVLQSTLIGH